MAYIEFKNVTKEYLKKDSKIGALKKVNFEIEKGELVVITGPSASGKTTLLNILGAIDKTTKGKIIVNKVDISSLKEKKLNKYRRENIGFIFQFINLFQSLSVKENIELSTQISKNKINADKIIKKMGLTKQKDNLPFELSNCEQKKVAIACAIAKAPNILLCDEITKDLDDKSFKQVLKFLQELIKKEKISVIITTHSDDNIEKLANKVISLKNGRILEVKENKKPKNVGDLSC